jgi:hypothetical protein
MQNERAQIIRSELELFAIRVEAAIEKSSGTGAMERLMCRKLTGKDAQVSARMLEKWVEWRFGKPKERVEVTLNYSEALQKMRAKRGQ